MLQKINRTEECRYVCEIKSQILEIMSQNFKFKFIEQQRD